ncbi:Pre-mRNA-processing factor 17 [Oopsacas minuta]|uniref:Pre-mRNA-processing factor 17 n=1 Tax=Oopsacas minuta TaxID=111878 RepID=A0AAV7JLE8_9METZ|nr:Pre-mRNA-processing factor 17 [Oopsacas minuta]
MELLRAYASSSDEEDNKGTCTDAHPHVTQVPTGPKEITPALPEVNLPLVNSAPEISQTTIKAKTDTYYVPPDSKIVMYNPTYEQMYAPVLGPENPYKSDYEKGIKNSYGGYYEPAHMQEFDFESQRRTFIQYGYANDPSTNVQPNTESTDPSSSIIGDKESYIENKGIMNYEKCEKSKEKRTKRVREEFGEPSNVDGYNGPWAKYENEIRVSKPTEEEMAIIEAQKRFKPHRRGPDKEPDNVVEAKTILHISEPIDYQGRSFLSPPRDVGINFNSPSTPDKCFLPKKHLHTWEGHSKGVSAIRWYPRSAHLLLSCSMDAKIKLWEVYNERRCIRTYIGHGASVRDISFSYDGTKFLSASYDKTIKLWDTENGKLLHTFSNRKMPYCVKFNPDGNKQHLFVAGYSDKKILTWDTHSGDVIQEYDRHLGAVNTITFVDDNRRFVTTSDDKSLRVWEWDIPVDWKYISDPSLHSMPAVTLHPTGKWLGCQSMDNQVLVFGTHRFSMNRKKVFKGHLVAGYACQVGFSPDGSYVISGDSQGHLVMWDWKTCRLFNKLKAHTNVCIGCLWHPLETSKVATCGWDGLIKLWD